MTDSRRLLITVHGIRTFGLWQDRLEGLVREADGQTAIVKIDYGYFSIIAFFLPFMRWLATRRIRRLLLAAVLERPWRHVDIVAHSFGTHLVAHSLLGIDPETRRRVRVRTLILAGSVLKPWFPWDRLMDGAEPCVDRVVNDCGTKDGILVLSHFFVLFTGMAGRVGFRGRIGSRLRNRYFAIGHSGYFVTRGRPNDFMKEWWLPVLLTEADVIPHDEREPSATASLLTWTLGYAEPVKLTGYAGAAWLLFLPVWGWYDESRVARFSTRIDALIALSTDLSKQRNDEGAAIVALAALQLDRRHGAGRRVAAENAVRAALSNRPFAHPLQDVDFAASAAAVTSDGDRIVAGAADGRIRVWDARSWSKPTLVDLPSKEAVTALAVEPLRARAAAGDPAGNVWIIDLDAPSSSPTQVAGCEGTITSLAWGAGGRLVAGTESRRLCIWNMTRPGDPARLVPLDAIVRSVAVSSDGKRLAAADGEQIRVFSDVDSPDAQPVLLPFEDHRVHALAFSPDGSQLAAAGMTTTGTAFSDSSSLAGATALRVFTVRTGRASAEMALATTVRSLAYSPSGSLAAAGSDGAVHLWEDPPRSERVVLPAHDGPVVSVAFDATGKLVTAAAGAPAVRRWSVSSALAAPFVFQGPQNPVLALAFCSPDQRMLALAYPYDSQPRLWTFLPASAGTSDVKPGQLPGGKGVTRTVACSSAQPNLVAVGRGSTLESSDSGIRLWDLSDTRRERAALPGPDGNVVSLAFDSTGAWLVAIGEIDKRVVAWDIASGQSIHVPDEAIEGDPVRVAASPTGRSLLAVATERGSIAVLELLNRSFRTLARFAPSEDGAQRGVHDLAFSPDGRQLAVVQGDGSLVVREPDRPRASPVLTLNTGQRAAQAAARVVFSPDGTTLLAGRADGSVIEWVVREPDAGFRILQGTNGPVYSLGIRPDGEYIAAGFADGSVRAWKSLAAVVRDGCTLVTPALQRPEWTGLVSETGMCGQSPVSVDTRK